MKNLIVALPLVAGLGMVSQNALATSMPPLAKKSGCTACHAIDHKVVGPAWADVAKRYKGDGSAKDKLISKVKSGGKGNWTAVTHGVPMPPYSPRVSDENIAKLVDFVLGL